VYRSKEQTPSQKKITDPKVLGFHNPDPIRPCLKQAKNHEKPCFVPSLKTDIYVPTESIKPKNFDLPQNVTKLEHFYRVQ
jgi:hypothetical protein